MKEDFENVKSVRLHYRYESGRLSGRRVDELFRSMWHKPTSKPNIPQPDRDFLPIDNAGISTGACNVESVYKNGNKFNSLTTRTPSSVYSMRARVSIASSAMTDLGFFDSMIMCRVFIQFKAILAV